MLEQGQAHTECSVNMRFETGYSYLIYMTIIALTEVGPCSGERTLAGGADTAAAAWPGAKHLPSLRQDFLLLEQ